MRSDDDDDDDWVSLMFGEKRGRCRGLHSKEMLRWDRTAEGKLQNGALFRSVLLGIECKCG